MHSDERTLTTGPSHATAFFSLRYRLLPLLLMLAVGNPALQLQDRRRRGDDGGDARFRVLNASTGYTSLDVYSNDQDDDDDDDKQRFSSVSYGAISDYVSLNAATYTLDFRRAGASTSLLAVSSQAMAEDTNATYVAYGSTGHFQVYKISDDQTEADSGKAAHHDRQCGGSRLPGRVFHGGEHSPDRYLAADQRRGLGLLPRCHGQQRDLPDARHRRGRQHRYPAGCLGHHVQQHRRGLDRSDPHARAAYWSTR